MNKVSIHERGGLFFVTVAHPEKDSYTVQCKTLSRAESVCDEVRRTGTVLF